MNALSQPGVFAHLLPPRTPTVGEQLAARERELHALKMRVADAMIQLAKQDSAGALATLLGEQGA